MSTYRLPKPLDKLANSDLTNRKLAEGETLFIQDSATTGLFFLAAGIVDLKRVTNAGHSVVIHRARPNDTFAEASLFSYSYHCTATAVCESLVVECNRVAMLRLLSTDIEFTRSMATRFATQIQETRRRVELLSIRSADERILTALKDGLLEEDITTFAATIGLAPETVYRGLAKLAKDSRIEKTARGHYQIIS